MYGRQVCSALAVLILLSTLLLVPAAPSVGAAAVDPQILSQMAASPDGRAGFFVLFREQADLTPAYAMRDWDARGRFVLEALQSAAQRSQAGVRAWLDARGIAYRAFFIDNSIFLTADLRVLQGLASFPEVAGFRANRTYAIAPAVEADGAPPEGITWNILKVRADRVWDELGIKGQGIVVANLDTGVDYLHDALFPNYKCGAGPHDDCWHDATGTCPTAPCDGNGHGTMVMGVEAADDDLSLPYNVGMAPDAQWIACKGCTDGGSCSDVELIECAQWFMAPGGNPANRPHVIANSWGGGGGCDYWFQAYIQVWRDAGIYPTFAPGGSGPGCSTVGSPAALSGVLATGATNQNDTIAPFSARGPSPCDGGIKPEVVAPGINIQSTMPGNAWSSWSGTSLSNPHSAGLVALLWSADPSLIGNYASTTLAITSTARCIEDLTCGGTPCPGGANNVYGWGRIDAYSATIALVECDPVAGLDFSWEPLTPTVDEVVTFNATAAGTPPISYTWNLGDGTLVSGPSAIAHAYPLPGNYTVVLTATNCETGTATISHTLTVVPIPCDAVADLDFAWEPLTPTVDEVVTFNATAAGTPPISYTWNLGDGTLVGGPSAIAHAYSLPGNYTVVLTATNCQTGTATISHTLTVVPIPCDPVADLDFAWEPLTPTVGQAIVFSAMAEGTPPIDYVWEMGDRSLPRAGEEITYTYRMAGSYDVRLKATNCGTATASVTRTVAVVALPRCEPVPAVDFSWAPPQPLAGRPALFTGYTPPEGWFTTTADSSGDVGAFVSLGMDAAGRPHISYYDKSGYDLAYAHYDGGAWLTETVDSAGDVGSFTSIAVDALGRPHIAYYDAGQADLKYARLDEDGWVIATVDGAGSVGRCASLALDSLGRPHISYFDDSNGAIRYAYYDGAWHIQTVDPAVGGVCDNALGLDAAGRPHVVYMVNTYELRYAYLDGTWQYETIAANGERPDLVVDGAGNPHVSYFSGGDLVYAHRDGAGWHNETVASVGWPTVFSSLAVDAAGVPHLSYYQNDVQGLHYARRAAGSWLLMTVDTAGTAGVYNSLALDAAGRPRIAYDEWTDQDLRYAWWVGRPTEPITYTWAWGDGSFSAGPPAPFTHTYGLAGPYTVVLTATNCGESGAAMSHTLVVSCAPLLGLDFSWQPQQPTAGQVVTFTAQASSTLPITYTWNLGDGASSVVPCPWPPAPCFITHTYTLPQTYTVALTATDGCARGRVAHEVPVVPRRWRIYLPLVQKGQ